MSQTQFLQKMTWIDFLSHQARQIFPCLIFLKLAIETLTDPEISERMCEF